MTNNAPHEFSDVVTAMAYLCGLRFMSKASMQHWCRDLRAWREGDMVMISLPMGIKAHAIASFPYSDDVAWWQFSAGPAFCEVETQGHA